MIENRIKLYNALSVITDLLAVVLAFAGAVRYAAVIPYLLGTDGLVYLNLRVFTALAVSALAIATLHLTFSILYQSLKNPFGSRTIWHLLPRIVGLGLADILMVRLSFVFFRAVTPSSDFYLSFGLTLIVVTVTLRVLMQRLMAWRFTSPVNHINILIVGTNERALDFYHFAETNRFLGCRVVGFLDDQNRGQREQDHVEILAPLAEFERVARENILDLVVVFLPIRSYYDKVSSIIEHASIQGIPVQHMYVLFDNRRVRMSASSIGEHSGTFIGSAPSNPWLLALKRLFDVAFSLLALILTSPVLLAAAIAIKLDNPGPVFFVQSRVGYHKRPIRVLKLRTMVTDAEKLMSSLESLNEMDGPVFKIKDDPRVTRVGRILRRYGIDELPQFVNVLLGDMSVVGPRPMSERDYLGFSEDWLRKRFSMAPGITCLWQIRPHRNQLSFTDWMNLDMEYIDQWSFWLDIKIILRTVLAVLGGTGT